MSEWTSARTGARETPDTPLYCSLSFFMNWVFSLLSRPVSLQLCFAQSLKYLRKSYHDFSALVSSGLGNLLSLSDEISKGQPNWSCAHFKISLHSHRYRDGSPPASCRSLAQYAVVKGSFGVSHMTYSPLNSSCVGRQIFLRRVLLNLT